MTGLWPDFLKFCQKDLFFFLLSHLPKGGIHKKRGCVYGLKTKIK